jgi:plasmid stabilization system protein ParE
LSRKLPPLPPNWYIKRRICQEVNGMPQAAWNPKRERQYKHIKESLKDRGASKDKAEEIAARTVNKARARAGEAMEPSRTSTDDISSERRGGLRSHTGSKGRTYDQLRNEARERGIKGRSGMSKAQLERAVDARKR